MTRKEWVLLQVLRDLGMTYSNPIMDELEGKWHFTSPGWMWPTLWKLEEKGLIEGWWVLKGSALDQYPRRHMYQLTETGLRMSLEPEPPSLWGRIRARLGWFCLGDEAWRMGLG